MVERRKFLMLSDSFRGALDSYPSMYWCCTLKRVLKSWDPNADAVTLRRSSDNAELGFKFRKSAQWWISKAEINAWLAADSAATAFLVQANDHSGNGRHVVQSNASLQAPLDLTGTYPAIDADGAAHFYDIPALAFAQNVGAVSLASVRKYDVTTTGTFNIIRFNKNDTAARLLLGTVTARKAGGRRLNANSFAGTTGFVRDTNWDVETARYDCTGAKLHHTMGAQSETLDPFQDAGSFENLASSSAHLFANGAAATEYFDGKCTFACGWQSLLSDVQDAGLLNSLASMKL